jgi:hypothetical protein
MPDCVWYRYCNKGLHSSCDVTNPSETQEMLYGHRTAGIHGMACCTAASSVGF